MESKRLGRTPLPSLAPRLSPLLSSSLHPSLLSPLLTPPLYVLLPPRSPWLTCKKVEDSQEASTPHRTQSMSRGLAWCRRTARRA
eukprot:49752-Hanusia_phi.AAC.2